MQIVTLHGIRRSTKWYEDFALLPLVKESATQVIPFEYGYFSISDFLRRSKRANVYREFQEFYAKKFDPQKPPSIICHSFGTFILYKTLEKYQAIRFDKVILCGSILKEEFDWGAYIDRGQVNQVLNDYGKVDSVVKFSRLVLREGGKSGQHGFSRIAEKHKHHIIQHQNSFAHSDYFLTLHMQENWAKFLIPPITFKYNSKVLRNEIIDRIYSNIVSQPIKYLEALFKSRVDEKGNYYAQYRKKGVNNSNSLLSQYIVTTTADSIQSISDLHFKAYSSDGENLSFTIREDNVQHKQFVIDLPGSLQKDEAFDLEYLFQWKETISYKTGDTDHYAIKNVRTVAISINTAYALKGPKFFVIRNKCVTQEIKAEKTLERDKTFTYKLNFENNYENDGIIFYFDGADIKTVNNLPKVAERFNLKDQGFIIDRCAGPDIREVYRIESDIENGNAASEIKLKQRRAMFPDGFMVVKHQSKVIAYVESLIWKERDIVSFEEIQEFPMFYDVTGNELYVIFIAVASAFRKQGLATKMLEVLEKIARRYNVEQIKLVAMDNLEELYKKSGFVRIKEIPDFLKDRSYGSILMIKKLE